MKCIPRITYVLYFISSLFGKATFYTLDLFILLSIVDNGKTQFNLRKIGIMCTLFEYLGKFSADPKIPKANVEKKTRENYDIDDRALFNLLG